MRGGPRHVEAPGPPPGIYSYGTSASVTRAARPKSSDRRCAVSRMGFSVGPAPPAADRALTIRRVPKARGGYGGDEYDSVLPPLIR